MKEPEFIEMPESFRVNLYRKSFSMETRKSSDKALPNVGDVGENVGENVGEMSEKDGDIVMAII